MELTDRAELKERIRQASKKYLTTEPQEDEFTVQDYMAWNGVSRNAAQEALTAMEADGVLVMRKGRLNGKSVNVYREK